MISLLWRGLPIADFDGCGREDRRPVMKSFLTILLMVPLTVAVPVTWGQAQRIQGGNVLDANPQLGSAGINSGSRQYNNNNMGNRIVSGNVTGGVAFRGFSPIRDPNSLFISVPRATGGLGGGPQ